MLMRDAAGRFTSKAKVAAQQRRAIVREHQRLLRQSPAVARVAQMKDAKAKAQLKAALSRFRPRKSERGQWVYITATKTRKTPAGTRVKETSRRATYAVYVAKSPKAKHKVKVFREPEKLEARPVAGGPKVRVKTGKARKTPVARMPAKHDLRQAQTKPLRKAAQKFYAVRVEALKTRLKKTMGKKGAERLMESYAVHVPILASGKGHDFYRDFAPKIAAQLQKAAQHYQTQLTFEVEVSAMCRDAQGNIFSVDFHDTFKQGDIRAMTDLGFYEPFVNQRLYAQMAQKLMGAGHGYVSAGSAKFIKALPANQGRPRRAWVDSRGGKWEKASKPVVDIIAYDARVIYYQLFSSD
jgi:hypothetical protein